MAIKRAQSISFLLTSSAVSVHLLYFRPEISFYTLQAGLKFKIPLDR